MKNIIAFLLIQVFFVTFSQQTKRETFNLQSITLKEGSIFCPPPNIVFDIGKATIRPESYPLLDSIVIFLNNHDEILLIEIGAHTDDNGVKEYSGFHSQRRAQSVVNYLIVHGISKERFKAKGYGEEMPLVPNNTKENKAKNRRVEFNILKISTKK